MTKRCRNCGWLNDDSNVKCDKCNAPLAAAQSPQPNHQQTVSYSHSENENLRKTVSESEFSRYEDPFGEDPRKTRRVSSNCPNCGYPVREGMSACPDCGTPLQRGAQPTIPNNPRMGTVDPWAAPAFQDDSCTLKPISWVGENIMHQPLSFTGVSVILNRSNTDPENLTITSKEQAELTFENGEWYIENKSAQPTTYVLASHRIKLNKGDIIVMGNRMFEFN